MYRDRSKEIIEEPTAQCDLSIKPDRHRRLGGSGEIIPADASSKHTGTRRSAEIRAPGPREIQWADIK